MHAPAAHNGVSLHMTNLTALLPAGTEEHHIRTGMEPGHGMGTTGTGMGHHGTGVTGMGTGMGTTGTGLGTAGMGHHGAGHGLGTTGTGYDETGKETMTHKIKNMIPGGWGLQCASRVQDRGLTPCLAMFIISCELAAPRSAKLTLCVRMCAVVIY